LPGGSRHINLPQGGEGTIKGEGRARGFDLAGKKRGNYEAKDHPDLESMVQHFRVKGYP